MFSFIEFNKKIQQVLLQDLGVTSDVDAVSSQYVNTLSDTLQSVFYYMLMSGSKSISVGVNA